MWRGEAGSWGSASGYQLIKDVGVGGFVGGRMGNWTVTAWGWTGLGTVCLNMIHASR